jgi:hypothetical protein
MATIRKSQVTGTLISIGNALKDVAYFPNANSELPWYTLCMSHEESKFFGSIHTARQYAGDPTLFCNGCRESVADRKNKVVGFLKSHIDELGRQVAAIEQTPVLMNRDFIKLDSMRSAVVKAQKKLGNLP